MDICHTGCQPMLEWLKVLIPILIAIITYASAVAGYQAYKRTEWLRGSYMAAFERIGKYTYKKYANLEKIPDEFFHGLATVSLFGDSEDLKHVYRLEIVLKTKPQKSEISLDIPEVTALLDRLRDNMTTELDMPWLLLFWRSVFGFPRRSSK